MAAIALDHLIKSLEIAHGLGEAIPGGSIVKAVAAVGLVIVKAAEAVRVNKEQCLEIAQRVAEHIFTIKEGLDDGGLPMGFEERLQDYCSVLEDIARTIERVGKIGWMKRSFKHATVAEETQKCLKKLDDAYKNIMLRSSLTTMSLVNRNLTANMISYDTANLPTGPSESDELPRIPSRHIHFSGTEISRSSRAGYILGLYDGHLEVSGAQRRKVLIRKYEMMADGSQAGFERELLVRRDMLHPNVTRLLGYSVVSQRTKMIIVEAGTTPATSYLSSLPPLDHFFESWRLMNELAPMNSFMTTAHPGREGYKI
ncbi:hypothetical protein SISSUDRAFT_532010 [Sistotremastrum suecicum HHB10207 ss-3]|uniref:Protein kinase domain-containing protein n=1 Tax=Sistotremastrum suecicum HHB10207 ss-3 TaxID=1314776 RepID=A0A166F4I2_9AGAM|nr:hypothetical protein SISSUDRAFT_532010 [Sistotremastrum suecicum HHB10207 ss-3]